MKTILNAGIYDLCHQGHLRLLERLRAMAGRRGRVVVVVHDDKSTFLIKGKIPIQALSQRIENLRITGLVDEVVVCESTDPAEQFENVVERWQEVTYVRGDDMKYNFPGQWKLEEMTIPIVFLPYTKGVSSTQIRTQLETL